MTDSRYNLSIAAIDGAGAVPAGDSGGLKSPASTVAAITRKGVPVQVEHQLSPSGKVGM